jgi:coenzyme F420-reducing hydrogenase delta subunit
MTTPRVVLFTCNWNGFSGLEAAGAAHRTYPESVLPIRVRCLGQISCATILKAFENGADGVLLIGCPHGECHYEFGNHRAQEVYAEAKRLVGLLGYADKQIHMDSLAFGDENLFLEKIRSFIEGLNGNQKR